MSLRRRHLLVNRRVAESAEEAQSFFDENKEPQIGFSIEDIAKKLLGDDYTEDWYPEEEQERDRRNMVISSYKDNNEMERLLMML